MAATNNNSATATKEAPVLSRQNPGRLFEVIVVNGQLGPWLGPIANGMGGIKPGTVFSEYEFRRIHPAPKKPEGWTEGDRGWEPANEYYERIFNHHLSGGPNRPATIKIVTDRTPDVTPLGPESNPPKPYVDPVISQISQGIREALIAPAPAPAPAK